MQQLVEGVHYFHNIGYSQYEQLFSRLKVGQHPEACLITCADSRIVPNLITNSKPGQIFTLRNVGNIVPCHGTSNNGEMAAVEYAVLELGIEHIIVCGHTCCGAMKQLVAPQKPGTASIQHWLSHADATAEIIHAHYGHLKGDALVNAAAEENVLVQLEHLRTLPIVASRLSNRKVQLHGWMYKLETGEVFTYDSAKGQFVKIHASNDSPLHGSAFNRNGHSNGRLTATQPATPRKKARSTAKRS